MIFEVEGVDLAYHGDHDIAPGLLDLAVNVRAEPPPGWLTAAVHDACGHLAAYPDAGPATRAVAAHHARRPGEVLLTAGAAEAFGLVARAVRPSRAVVVHPQFTEPERALRVAGHTVARHVLDAAHGFRLDPAAVPDDADLVVVGNPTNPTGVLHPAADLLALARTGRVLMVDEAFMDAVPGEPASLAAHRDVPGLVVVRSLTKTWGLAGLRVGYLLAEPALVSAARAQQPPWSVSTPALAAAAACVSPRAAAEAGARAVAVERLREVLRGALTARGLACVPGTRAPFLLVPAPAPASWPSCGVRAGVPGEPPLVAALRDRGVAVRRCDTFPGLGPEWIRIAVRDENTQATLLAALDELLAGPDGRPARPDATEAGPDATAAEVRRAAPAGSPPRRAGRAP